MMQSMSPPARELDAKLWRAKRDPTNHPFGTGKSHLRVNYDTSA